MLTALGSTENGGGDAPPSKSKKPVKIEKMDQKKSKLEHIQAQNELVNHSGKKERQLNGVPKLEDANESGSKNAHKCTLILAEGDSGKCLAMSGIRVVGRDYYGVLPLYSKLLNVREATHKQIIDNQEIKTLIKIIGLQFKKKY